MSAISELVRPALYTKLNVSGITNLATGGVHEGVAPSGTSRPYVTFRRQAPGAILHAFGTTGAPTNVLEKDLWAIKALTDAATCPANKSPQELGAEILQACETALGSSLTIVGYTVRWFAKFSDIPEYEEQDGKSNQLIYQRGFNWLIQVS